MKSTSNSACMLLLTVEIEAHSPLVGKEEIQHGDGVNEPQSDAAGCGRCNHVVQCGEHSNLREEILSYQVGID